MTEWVRSIDAWSGATQKGRDPHVIWIVIFIFVLAVTVLTVMRSTSTLAGAKAPPEQSDPTSTGTEPPEPAVVPPDAEPATAEPPTLTAPPLAIPWPPPSPLALPAPAAEVPAPAATAPAAAITPAAVEPQPVPVAPGPIVIVEDLGLDDVLAVAEEPAAAPRYPALKLVTGIVASGLVFAGSVLLLVRGLGALFGKLLRP